MGTLLPLLKCLRTHYGRHCEPFSVQNALRCRILHVQSRKFSGGYTPDGPPQQEGRTVSALIPAQLKAMCCRGAFCRGASAPGAWTQTPNSAWLATVPIVPVFFETTPGFGVSSIRPAEGVSAWWPSNCLSPCGRSTSTTAFQRHS